MTARDGLGFGATDRSFDAFVEMVREALSSKAADKGYAAGPDGPNPLYELTGEDHALGEVVYKAVRFRSRHDQDDLIKIAAWAFLLWRHNRL